MLFTVLAEEPRWGRAIHQSDVESCLLKAAAAGHWVAALDACGILNELAASGQTGTASSSTNAARVNASVSSCSACRCCVDCDGRSAANVAADHGHWFTAWVLAEKLKMQVSHPEDEEVLAAVKRGAELEAQVKVDDESAKQQEATEAQKCSGPRVIHVDDDLPPPEDDSDSDSSCDTGGNAVDDWYEQNEEELLAACRLGASLLNKDASKFHRNLFTKRKKKKRSDMAQRKVLNPFAVPSNLVSRKAIERAAAGDDLDLEKLGPAVPIARGSVPKKVVSATKSAALVWS